MKKEIKIWTLSALLVAFAALYPVIFTYAQNVAEVDFVEVLPLVLLYPAVGFAIWIVFSLATKSPLRSALSAVLMVFILSNYMLLQKVVQMVFVNLKYWHILPIVLFIAAHILYLLFRFEEKTFEEIVPVGALVMVVLLLVNLVPAVPTILQKMASDSESTSIATAVEETDQPNIYWFIFDECASFPVIENFYNYTDKDVYDSLISKGFYISNSSRNETTDTHRIMTNCINLDYVVDSSMNMAEIETYRKNPLLYNILHTHNYVMRGIGDTAWLRIESITTDKQVKGETADGTGIVEMQLQNSVIAPFLVSSYTEQAELVLNTLGFFKQADNIDPNSSQFNFTYVSSPHVPFLFDENGKNVSALNYNNWDDPRYYVGQYRFVMNQIIDIVDVIIANDPMSVIILQSDHGPRSSEGLTFEDKTSILNCVYFMGEDISEIEGKSSVNTLRIVLNRLLGCQLEEVPIKYAQ